MKPTKTNRWGQPVWEVKEEFSIWFDDGLAQVGGWTACTFDADELDRLATAAVAAAEALRARPDHADISTTDPRS